jgi:ribosomal protein L20
MESSAQPILIMKGSMSNCHSHFKTAYQQVSKRASNSEIDRRILNRVDRIIVSILEGDVFNG